MRPEAEAPPPPRNCALRMWRYTGVHVDPGTTNLIRSWGRGFAVVVWMRGAAGLDRVAR